MARRQKSVFEVECTRCNKFLGSAASNKQASRIMEVHEREDHGYTGKVFKTVSRPEIPSIFD